MFMTHDGDRSATWQLHCPVQVGPGDELVSLAHGEGGRLSRKFIQERIVRHLGNRYLDPLDDAARLPALEGPVAMTTDSYVVSPMFFPGGDIGSLAVYGTVNDLAVSGAEPRYLTLALIVEEGLPMAVLERVLQSIADAARRCEVRIVAGDTKVVPRGAADGLLINTAGIGPLVDPVPPGPAALCEGDALIASGPIGRHGVAVLAAREDFGFTPPPTSDSAPLVEAVAALRRACGADIRAMRDATRGGLGAVLHEWAAASGRTLTIEERQTPVSAEVRGACELLGLDPVHMANEGTMLVAVAPDACAAALAALHTVSGSAAAVRIGAVVPRAGAPVTVRRTLGPEQPLDEPLGAPLPRIC
jgi:hydrogenase expression/formation protein HypE